MTHYYQYRGNISSGFSSKYEADALRIREMFEDFVSSLLRASLICSNLQAHRSILSVSEGLNYIYRLFKSDFFCLNTYSTYNNA